MNPAYTKFMRVYGDGPNHTQRFYDAKGLLILENRGLITRAEDIYYNRGGSSGANARKGIRMTIRPVYKTDKGVMFYEQLMQASSKESRVELFEAMLNNRLT